MGKVRVRKWARYGVVAAAAWGLMLAAGCRRGQQGLLGPTKPSYQDAMTPLITAQHLDFMRWANVSDFQPALQHFYESRQYEPAWTKDGRLTEAAKGWIAAFSKAEEKGLAPEDYDASRWTERQSWLAGGGKDNIARFDVALTIDAMRYASDLHSGRVSPQHFNFEIDAQSKRLDLPKFLTEQAINAEDVPKLLSSVEPEAEGYRALEEALPKYLKMAKAEASTPREPLLMVTKPLNPGDAYAEEEELEARLEMEGYAAQSGRAPGNGDSHRFSPDVSDVVKDYQSRHGLTPDGKLTPATIKSLNVPMADRVRQIDDSLERWRWLPEPYVQPRLMVNLPEFLLRGYTPDHKRGEFDDEGGCAGR